MTLLKAELVDLDGCSVRWVGRQAVVTLPAEIDLNNADLVGHHLFQVLDDHPLGLVADMPDATPTHADGRTCQL
jgi:hypothetical protein